MATAPESILERLRIGARLGHGAAGEVYAGLLDDEEVAVKVVRGPVSEATARRVKREAWLRERRTALVLARHPHPNTLKCFAAFEAPAGCSLKQVAAGDGVLVLERGYGMDLPVGATVSVLGPLVLDAEEQVEAALRAGRIAVSIASALAHMHTVVKTIHRDVKPDNLLMVDDRVCLCDFSAARTQLYTLQRATTKKGIGTMGYLAPEMYAKEARYCSKVDMWSLGTTALQYYNCGKPCSYGDFHRLASALQFGFDAERIAEERKRLDEVIDQELWEQLPDEEGPVAALRAFLRCCFRTDPADRPGAVALLRAPETLALAMATSLSFQVPTQDFELLEGRVERAVTLADLMQELMWRFSDPDEKLGVDELNLLRDGMHRALEAKDQHSLELLECWVSFVKGCPGVSLEDRDVTTGRSVLHALVQNHRQEALLEMIEDCYEYEGLPIPGSLTNTLDEDGRTPLWLASANATSATVSLRLLELDADPNVADSDGVTPLEVCAGDGFNRPGERREDVLAVLVAFGAKPKPHLLDKKMMLPSIRSALELSPSEARAKVEVWQKNAECARRLRRELRDIGDGSAKLATSETEESSAAAAEKEVVEAAADAAEEEAEGPVAAVEEEAVVSEEDAESPKIVRKGKRRTTEMEDRFKAQLFARAGHHAMTAFRLVRKKGGRRVQVDDLIKALREALPEEDAELLEKRLRERWSKGISSKDFVSWIQAPSKSDVDARRQLPTQRRRETPASPARRTGSPRPASRAGPARPPSRGRPASPEPEVAAGLKGSAAKEARVRGALIELFWRLDEDASTVLDVAQFTKGYELLMEGVEDRDDPSAAFKSADANASNDVDEDEWLTWTMEQMLPGLKISSVSLARRLEMWLRETC